MANLVRITFYGTEKNTEDAYVTRVILHHHPDVLSDDVILRACPRLHLAEKRVFSTFN